MIYSPPSESPERPQRKTGRRWIRNAAIGTAALAVVIGAGATAVYAADASDSGTLAAASSQTAGQHKTHAGKVLHSESVVDRNGSTVTLDRQSGTVESVSATSITVKSSDGFSQTYVLDSSTKLLQAPAKPAAGEAKPAQPKADRPKPTSITSQDLKAGDSVRVSALKAGSTLTAERVVLAAK